MQTNIVNSSLPDTSWCWALLDELGDLNRGKSKHRPRDDKRLFNGKYPFIQTGEIRNSGGLISNYVKTYSEFGLKQSKLWPKNTLCITIATNIAETAILNIPACFPDSVVGFIPNDEVTSVKFIHFYIKTIKNRLESYAPATAQKNINVETLKDIVVPLPSVSEQHEIVKMIERSFSIIDSNETVVLNSLQYAQMLRQSILKNAFEGKLAAGKIQTMSLLRYY